MNKNIDLDLFEEDMLKEMKYLNKIEQVELSQDTKNILKKLTPIEEKVIRMRFGIGAFDGNKTYQETSEELGLSMIQVREIEFKALMKLEKKYEDYIDNL